MIVGGRAGAGTGTCPTAKTEKTNTYIIFYTFFDVPDDIASCVAWMVCWCEVYDDRVCGDIVSDVPNVSDDIVAGVSKLGPFSTTHPTHSIHRPAVKACGSGVRSPVLFTPPVVLFTLVSDQLSE